MANQTVPTTPAHEDVIVLGGQTFPIANRAQGDMLNEFEVGLKTGSQDYDTRTQAFFHVYEDFSGGMGFRRLDLRDPKTMNTFWDYPLDGTAADTRRAGHLTLGPLRARATPTKPALLPTNGAISPSVPYTTDGSCWAFGYGSALYSTTDGIIFSKMYDNTDGFCSALVPFPGGYRGFVATYFAIFRNGTIFYALNTNDSLCDSPGWKAGKTSLTSGSDTSIAGTAVTPTVTTVDETDSETVLDGSASKVTALHATTSVDPGPPQVTTEDSSETTTVQDGSASTKVTTHRVTTVSGGSTGSVGKNPTTPFTIAAPASGFVDGVYWDEKILVSAKNMGLLFGIITPDDGAAHWNVEDPNDKTFVGVPMVSGDAQAKFIGIEKAPWGEPAAYFTAGGQTGADVWVLDFFSRKVYPVKVGLEVSIRDGKVWSGQVCVTDGENLFAYDVGQQRIVNIGFPRRDGHFPTLHAPSGADMLLSYLLPSDIYLYALAHTDSLTAQDSYSDLYCYNGRGWHRIGSHITDNWGSFAAIANYSDTRRLHIFGQRQSDSAMVVDTITLQSRSHIPVYGIDSFETTGGLITSWNDGGFADLQGAALKMDIDARHLSSTETVKVEYQLDNDEDMAWLSTYDSNGNVAVFNDSVSTVYFQRVAPRQGAQFRTIRFRITLSRGTNVTHTPEVKALIFTYVKKPRFRSTWTFEVDINRMLEASNATAFAVDGNAPTMANVWQKLQDLRNTMTLLSLTIPSVETDDLNVTISGMPLTFDDFRDAVKGKGTLTLKVLEPIPSSG